MSGDNPFVATVVDPVVDRIDRLQRRRRLLAFPFAVFKRYGEDNGGWVSALISYYGFFSLFPLLVVFVSVATWILGDRPDLLHRVLEAVWSRVPFGAAGLQESVEDEVQTFQANVWVMIVSIAVTLWGGMGVVRVLQDAVNIVWGVARFRRPGFFPKLARGLAILGLLGLGLVTFGVVAGLTVTVTVPAAGLVVVAIANVVLGALIVIAMYHLSIAEPTPTSDFVPGAILMSVGGYGLSLVAGIYVQDVIARTSGIYGPFASTIGLLAYVSLIVQLFVVATEVNVVRAKCLWPRSLTGRALGTPDARAVEVTLRRERMLSHQQLTERGLTEAAAAEVGAEDVEPPPPSSPPSSRMTE